MVYQWEPVNLTKMKTDPPPKGPKWEYATGENAVTVHIIDFFI